MLYTLIVEMFFILQFFHRDEVSNVVSEHNQYRGLNFKQTEHICLAREVAQIALILPTGKGEVVQNPKLMFDTQSSEGNLFFLLKKKVSGHC